MQVRAQFESLEVATVSDDLLGYIAECIENAGSSRRTGTGPVPDGLRKDIDAYLQNRDVIRLASVIGKHSNCRLVCIEDSVTGQLFLAIHPSRHDIPWIVNVTGAVGDRTRTITAKVGDTARIHDFVRTRSTWLQFAEDIR